MAFNQREGRSHALLVLVLVLVRRIRELVLVLVLVPAAASFDAPGRSPEEGLAASRRLKKSSGLTVIINVSPG